MAPPTPPRSSTTALTSARRSASPCSATASSSRSLPNLIVYTKDARDRIVKREVLLTGWGGVDHDHGLHAVVFGPDGRYYFNAGNEGYDVTDRSGQRVRAPRAAGLAATAPIGAMARHYEGAAMVVNPDGTGLRVLAQNFRNPYELAIDAFGDIWQTDNDDDGNAWTRANYVMEGGNYGFRGPRGRRWQDDAGSHFHEELPGVVPNLLRLGPGSPCGLLVYEGTLLPEAYRGHLLHAEAGRRVIAHYPLTVDWRGLRDEDRRDRLRRRRHVVPPIGRRRRARRRRLRGGSGTTRPSVATAWAMRKARAAASTGSRRPATSRASRRWSI